MKFSQDRTVLYKILQFQKNQFIMKFMADLKSLKMLSQLCPKFLQGMTYPPSQYIRPRSPEPLAIGWARSDFFLNRSVPLQNDRAFSQIVPFFQSPRFIPFHSSSKNGSSRSVPNSIVFLVIVISSFPTFLSSQEERRGGGGDTLEESKTSSVEKRLLLFVLNQG